MGVDATLGLGLSKPRLRLFPIHHHDPHCPCISCPTCAAAGCHAGATKRSCFLDVIVRRRIEENISGERLAQLLQEQSAKPLLVDFVAEWCGPCKMLSPVLHKLASSPDLVGGKDIDLVTMDVDHEIGAAQKYGVRAMPTVIAFKDGRPVSQFVGVLPEAQLRQFIQGL